jgi:hypothetical protein
VSVYVDPIMCHGGSATFRWKHSCHMYADTVEELHEFAKKIGMKAAWFQTGGRLDHFDLTIARRRLAVKLGAIETTREHIVSYMKPRGRTV